MISLKKNTAKTEKIKYTKESSANAFITEGNEKVMVDISACSPLYLFSSLKSLLTLMTLMILAS